MAVGVGFCYFAIFVEIWVQGGMSRKNKVVFPTYIHFMPSRLTYPERCIIDILIDWDGFIVESLLFPR